MNRKIDIYLVMLFSLLFSSVITAAEMKTSEVYDASYDRTWDALIWTADIRRDVNISTTDKETGKVNLQNKGMGNGAGFATIEMEIKEIDTGKTAVMFITEGKTWARNINRGWTAKFLSDIKQRLKKK
ncbi:MAG: hypothetical protein DRQ47_00420 [Gammaproteobacteria bacterium]|nr:MAG: hypothetical protein DRQ47_00420 [Gammaproteobacteria bacterium]